MAGPNFFSGFNKWDWSVVTLGIAVLLGLNTLVIENRLNSIRIDFARLEANVGHSTDDLKAAIERHRTDVNSLIQAGLATRSDEIARALLASQDEAQWFYVQVANVPSGSEIFTDLKALASNFDAPSMMQFGDRVAFDFYVSKLSDSKAMTLQTILSSAEASGVDTSITISSPPAN